LGKEALEKEKLKHLLDNISKEQLIELEACVTCSECLNWCPIQDVTKDPSISTPSKIKMFKKFVDNAYGLRAKIFGPKPIDEESLAKFIDALYTCTGCGGCGPVCEVGIHTQRLWWTLRRKMVDLGVTPPGGIPNLVKFVKETRNIYNQPQEERFRIWLPEDIKIAEKAEVGYFEGCGLSYNAAPMVEGALRIFKASGTEFTMLDPEEEWCCGFPPAVTGQWEILQELVDHNIEKIEERGISKLIVSCPCCLQQLRAVWPKVYGGKLPFKVEHVIQFAWEKVDNGELEFSKSIDDVVTFHDPCQLSRGLKGPAVIETVRKFIKSLPGVEFVEMERHGETTRCCGAGGGIRLYKPELAMEMGKLLIQDAKNAGAKTLLMCCPACYAVYVHRRIAPPYGEEWKKYEAGIRFNDVLQYAMKLL
jgi:heterodisulfide reductase subunit D